MSNTTGTRLDPAAEGAQLDFDGRMSYGDYLSLDRLLDAQHPVSGDHNEMLFIIQHQATELWMKLVLHEMRAVTAHVREDQLPPAFKMMARVARIFQNLNQAWQILANLTPAEYLRFRGKLGQSSGFQSRQYRAIEFLAGNKNAALMRSHAHRPEIHGELQQLLEIPSLYDEANALSSHNTGDREDEERLIDRLRAYVRCLENGRCREEGSNQEAMISPTPIMMMPEARSAP